jgi:membrane protease YdiL (CAAX protease family)
MTAPAPNHRLHLDLPRWALGYAVATVLVATAWYLARADVMGLQRAAQPWFVVTERPREAIVAFTLTLILFGVIPVALARPVLDRSPWDLGLGRGNYRLWLKLLALGVPVGILAGYIAHRSPGIEAVYPLGGRLVADPAAFAVHAGGYLLYYLGFEYLFRGFLLFGTKDEIGPAAANLLQACLATAFHFGKPGLEMAAVFPASLVFGWLALATESIWCPLGIHWVVGAAVDYFLVFGR